MAPTEVCDGGLLKGVGVALVVLAQKSPGAVQVHVVFAAVNTVQIASVISNCWRANKDRRKTQRM